MDRSCIASHLLRGLHIDFRVRMRGVGRKGNEQMGVCLHALETVPAPDHRPDFVGFKGKMGIALQSGQGNSLNVDRAHFAQQLAPGLPGELKLSELLSTQSQDKQGSDENENVQSHRIPQLADRARDAPEISRSFAKSIISLSESSSNLTTAKVVGDLEIRGSRCGLEIYRKR